MRRRVGRPGLMGLAARTAVVAGTANAVSGSMSRKAEARSQQEAEAEAYRQQQPAAAQSAAMTQPPPPAAPEVAAPTGDAVLEALERLAALHAQGILTDDELAQQKARILGG